MSQANNRWKEYCTLRESVKNDIITLLKEKNINYVDFKMDSYGNLPNSDDYDVAEVINARIELVCDNGMLGHIVGLYVQDGKLYADCEENESGEIFSGVSIGYEDVSVLIGILEQLEDYSEKSII